MSYLVSVVIPTKDRYKYLKHLIRTIKSFELEEIEVVVQDNTEDNSEIVDFLDDLNYHNCHYYHETGFIPMSDNADKAILHSNGEYVCFLGDDDGICPNVVEWAHYMSKKGIGALRSNLPAYIWPDAISISEDAKGTLSFNQLKPIEIVLQSQNVILDVFKRGFMDRGDLPSVYHGLVSRKVLDVVYNKCNTFFPGQSPDISNGIAVALVLESFVKTNSIITISGISKYHGGKVKGINVKYPTIGDMKWFRPGAEEMWDKRLPRMAGGCTIWAESAIETLRNMGRPELIDLIDFEAIYKNYVTYYFPVRKLAYPLSKNKSLAVYATLSFIRRVLVALRRRLYAMFGITKKGEVCIHGPRNIEQCILILSKHQK